MGQAKRRRTAMLKQPCAYCGAPSVSIDHALPRCIFPPGQEGLITVPSCETHNNHRSNMDQQFLEFLGLASGTYGAGFDHRLWLRAAKSLSRSHPRRQGLIDRSVYHRPTDEHVTLIGAEPFREGIRSAVRGLFWHHRGQPFGLEVPIEVQLLDPSSDFALLEAMVVHHFPGGEAWYAFGIAEEDDRTTFWYFGLPGNIIADAWTGMAAESVASVAGVSGE